MKNLTKVTALLTCAAVGATMGNLSAAAGTVPLTSLSNLYTNVDTSKPNIILITSDQQRLDTLGCYGSTFAVSPNLDRLATEGVRFTDSFTVSPVCQACRTSLITGVHTPISGTIENSTGVRNPALFTYPDYLRTAGYRTILIGKTHFGDDTGVFDVLDHYAESNPNDPMVAQRSIEEMQKATADGVPFYLHCSMLAPHGPFPDPNTDPDFKRWMDYYANVDLPPIDYTVNDFADIPDMVKMVVGLNKAPSVTDERLDYRQQYYAYASLFDEQVGKVLDYLDQNHLR